MLQTYLNANLISITDDGDLKKLKKTSDDIVKKILKTKAKIATYTRLAIDPNVSADNVDILEVRDLIVKNWNTFAANSKDTPLTFIRGVMLEALDSIATNIDNATIIWLSAKNVVKYFKLSGEEKKVILQFLLNCGRRVSDHANEAWSFNENVVNGPSENLELKDIKTYLVNSESLQKYLEDASGPHNQQGKANFDNPNPHWPNSNDAWSHQFAPRTAKGIKVIIDLSLKAIADLSNENKNSIQKAFNSIASIIRHEAKANDATLKLRSELLWWKEACYSNSFDESYRTLPEGIVEIALIKDYSFLIPTIYPNSADFFLLEMYRSLNIKCEQNLQIKSLIEQLKTNSIELKKILPETNIEAGRVSLLNYISGVIWGKFTLEQADDLLGFAIETEIKSADAILWLFHDSQLEKAINS